MSVEAGSGSDVESFVDGLVRIGTRELAAELGVAEGVAERAMRRLADAVCTEYARCQIYVPVAYDARNREIVAKYHQSTQTARACTPARIKELAAEYALTWRQIYSILKASREADWAARQGVIPGLEDPADSPS